MNGSLKRLLTETVAECYKNIPGFARNKDVDKIIDFHPIGLFMFKLPYEDVMKRAIKARRQGVKSRATCLEYAFDSLLAHTEWYRVGEVYKSNWYSDQTGKAEPMWTAWVRER